MAVTSLAQSSGLRLYKEIIKSSTTWTAPAGVSMVDIIMAGGGGGGGAAFLNTSNAGCAAGGGGGGQIVRTSLPVTAGTQYAVVVGAGGSGSTDATASGGTGGNSSFGLTTTLANGFSYGQEHGNSLAAAGYNANTVPRLQAGWFFKYNVGGGYTLTNPMPYANANTSNSSPRFEALSNQYSNLNSTLPSASNGYGFSTFTGTTSGTYCDLSNWVPVTGNTTYVVSAWTVSTATSASVSNAIRIEWYESFQGNFISATNGISNTIQNSSWQQRSVSGTAPANATFALVRFQQYSTATSNNYTGWAIPQFELGSTPTAYKGAFGGTTTWTPNGIFNVTAGALAVGGGGGASANTSVYTFAGVGGGGASYSATAGYTLLGGHGSGAGGLVTSGNFRSQHVDATAGVLSYQRWFLQQQGFTHPATGRPTASARPYTNMTNPMSSIYFAGAPAPASPEGLSAGGSGGLTLATQSLSDIEYPLVSYGAGIGAVNDQWTIPTFGTNALANTGSGGGGAAAYGTTNATSRGGDGGSGVVILTYWGY